MKNSILKASAAAVLAGVFAASPLLTTMSYGYTETSGAEPGIQSGAVSFSAKDALYAHAVVSSEEKDAWVAWQCAHDDELNDYDVNTRYFFMPACVDESAVELYNAGSDTVTIGSVGIAPGEIKQVPCEFGKEYSTDFSGQKITFSFLRSTAEAAVYVNNSNADGNGTELLSYLSSDKERSAAATGAIVTRTGSVDNTPIKKIKGRGNTTWWKSKKPFNITYESKVSVAGMTESKKYSLLANYQDDSLCRNRFLYDLSDAVGLPYASDSRFVDLYMNGVYIGSYQMTEKIEAGKSHVVNDFGDKDYLGEDGKVKADFPFVCEVDPNAGSDDFTVSCSDGIKLTIKCPELSPGDVGYDEVKQYVKSKFNGFYYACANPDKRDLSEYGDIDSLTKLYLINELGKNWDSGAASTYFTYKQSADGKFRFFGSPVWDYDNSLGNCTGVSDDLKSMGVKDYTKYTGWWCRYKGRKKGSSKSSNIMNNISVNDYITEAAPKIWFESFVPAMRHFSGEAENPAIDVEFYTRSEYYDIIKGSAEMNYKSGWLLNTGSWICDHSKLAKASFDYTSGVYSASSENTKYKQNFDGMYNYAADWFESRAAWLSQQMYDDYKKSASNAMAGDLDGDGTITSNDALTVLRASVGAESLGNDKKPSADIDGDGNITANDALEILRISVGRSV